MTTVQECPPERITVTINNTSVPLFMSFGLLNTLVAPITSVDELIQIDQDPELRNFVLEVCLTKRDDDGQRISKPDLNAISYSEGEEVLDWARGHLNNFFTKRLKNRLQTQKTVNQTILP